MEVLKDASAAAIYGTRASNGVILITTKKGKTGKARINWNSSVGFQTVAKPNIGTIRVLRPIPVVQTGGIL